MKLNRGGASFSARTFPTTAANPIPNRRRKISPTIDPVDIVLPGVNDIFVIELFCQALN
jgi:hypothetical protein